MQPCELLLQGWELGGLSIIMSFGEIVVTDDPDKIFLREVMGSRAQMARLKG